jgi:hypothetical protein
MLPIDAYREHHSISRAVTEAGIDDPLQAFEHAWGLVRDGKARSAELLTMTSKYPFQKLDHVSSPILTNTKEVSIDSPEAQKLSDAIEAFVEDVAGVGVYEDLMYRVTRQLTPNYESHEDYFDVRAWIAPTSDPNTLLGVQSAVNDRGELSRRIYVTRKPFNLKDAFLEFWQNAAMAPGFASKYWRAKQ